MKNLSLNASHLVAIAGLAGFVTFAILIATQLGPMLQNLPR